MQIPKYDDLFNPLLLAFHQLGGYASVPQMEKKVAEILNLTETELNEPHRGSRTKFQYNLAWTRWHLKIFGVIEQSARGTWSLTPKGKKLEKVDKNEVKQFVKNRDLNNKKRLNLEEIDVNEIIKKIDLDQFKYKPHFLKNPGNRLGDILTNSEKKWVLPNFQRYYDWDKEDVRAFLESIFRDYFVGSLLLWDVEGEIPIDTFPIYGVRSKIEKPDAVILDGQQRITSIYYALRTPEIENDGIKSYFYIDFKTFFESTSKDLIIALNKKLSTEDSVKYLLFPIYELENYVNWFREFEDYYENDTIDKTKFRDMERIMQDRVIHMLNGFQIPDIRLPATMKLHHVVDIFENINTKGKPLDAFDLLIAASSKHKIDLRKLWDFACKNYPNLERYSDKTNKLRMYVIQSISLLYNPTSSSKKSDILEIYEQIYSKERGMDPKTFEKHWEEMIRFVNQAIEKIENLKDGFGALNEDYVPFMPTIPILAALLKEIDGRENKHDCNKKIKQWYWSIVFNEAYSSSVDSQLTSDFKELKEWFTDDNKVPKNVVKARIKMQTLSFRKTTVLSSSLYKGILSLLALSGSRDLKTGEMVKNRADYDKDHLFPQSKAEEFSAGKDIDSVLNISWLTKTTNEIIKRAKEPKKYFKEFSDEFKGNKDEYLEVLASHYITSEGYEYLLLNDFKNFTKLRDKLLVEEIKALIGWTQNDIINEPDETFNIYDLLQNGENENSEFKSTFKKNLETGKADDLMKFSVLKTIAGLLNANGGLLVIGYDEKNKKIVGLQEDYSISKWQDKDGFEKEFWDYLEANIPREIIDKCINLRFETLEEKDLAIVEIRRVFGSPIYIEKSGKKNFYVRRKNETELIEDPEEADKYKRSHY